MFDRRFDQVLNLGQQERLGSFFSSDAVVNIDTSNPKVPLRAVKGVQPILEYFQSVKQMAAGGWGCGCEFWVSGVEQQHSQRYAARPGISIVCGSRCAGLCGRDLGLPGLAAAQSKARSQSWSTSTVRRTTWRKCSADLRCHCCRQPPPHMQHSARARWPTGSHGDSVLATHVLCIRNLCVLRPTTTLRAT